jgi:hypothetical protein
MRTGLGRPWSRRSWGCSTREDGERGRLQAGPACSPPAPRRCLGKGEPSGSPFSCSSRMARMPVIATRHRRMADVRLLPNTHAAPTLLRTRVTTGVTRTGGVVRCCLGSPTNRSNSDTDLPSNGVARSGCLPLELLVVKARARLSIRLAESMATAATRHRAYRRTPGPS